MSVESFKTKVHAGKKQTRLEAENKQLRAQLKLATQQLSDAREAGGLVLPERTRRKTKPVVYGRLIVPDTHGNHAEPAAIQAMLKDAEGIDIREIVMLGDHVECGGFLSLAHTLGYVAQIDEYPYEEDVKATNDLLDLLQKTCPKAQIHYMEGNHEQRVERWCVDAAKGNRANAEMLMKFLSPRNVLKLQKRGIKYYKMDEKHGGLSESGVLKLGKSFFTHGISTAKHAAAKTVDKFGGCVFFGHTHRADYYVTKMVNVGLVSGWCFGCLCKLSPRWRHNQPSGWSHGYGLQIINQTDDTFHAMHVPIEDGRSYLSNLIRTIDA